MMKYLAALLNCYICCIWALNNVMLLYALGYPNIYVGGGNLNVPSMNLSVFCIRNSFHQNV